jgi:hypothetical protein
MYFGKRITRYGDAMILPVRKNGADCFFDIGEGLRFAVTFGHDFRQGWNQHGIAATLLGFEDDRETVIFRHERAPVHIEKYYSKQALRSPTKAAIEPAHPGVTIHFLKIRVAIVDGENAAVDAGSAVDVPFGNALQAYDDGAIPPSGRPLS